MQLFPPLENSTVTTLSHVLLQLQGQDLLEKLSNFYFVVALEKNLSLLVNF